MTPEQDKFCDNNCVWTDHHPDCKLSQQEPVLVECGNCHEGLADMEHVCKKCLGAGWVNNLQPKEPEQEPVAVIGSGFQLLYCRNDWSKGLKVGDCLYTTPPQRKPLTDEQIDQIADEFIVDYRIPAGSHYDFAQAIEAAHGIKE